MKHLFPSAKLCQTFFFYFVLLHHHHHVAFASDTQYVIDNTEDYIIAQSQCKATCLKSYVDGLQSQVQTEGDLSLTANYSIDTLRNRTYLLEIFCHRRSSCKRCDDGCKANQTTNCYKHCEGDTFCIAGCQDLLHLMTAKERQCADHFKSLSSRPSCHRMCDNDKDCTSKLNYGSKCCRRGCLSYCASATSFYQELPSIPTISLKHSSSKEKLKNVIEWRPVNQDFTRPIVYAILFRFVVSDKFQSENASQWYILDVLTQNNIKLNEMQVGYIYQIKMAAVSHLGTRGFGKLSQYIRLPQNPRPPNVPLNLTDGVWRIYASGSINVNINWMKPKPSDLEIYAYEICWVRDHGYVQSDGKSIVSFTKFTKRVFPKTFSYVIENLEAATSYKVELRAQSKWGEHDLFSRPNTIYITTPMTRDIRNKEIKDENSSNSCRCDDQKRLEETGFTITPPIFDGSLTMSILRVGLTKIYEPAPYQVEWTPSVCIDSKSHSMGTSNSPSNGHSFKATSQTSLFVLRNLTFNCRYTLRITQLHDLKSFLTCFCTSSCTETRMRKDSKPKKVCPSTIEPHALEPPTSLKVLRKDKNGNSFIVHWTHQINMRHPITNYRVVWGPRLNEPVNKESYSQTGLQAPLDVSRAQTRVVKKNVNSLVLENLSPATLYIVKVQALSFLIGRESESLEIESIFTTPGFPNYPVNTANFSGEVNKYVKHPMINSSSKFFSTIVPWYRSILSFAAFIFCYDPFLRVVQRQL